MLDQFINFINEKQLLESGRKVLLAVSGGIDSMVLLHLFERSGFEYGIVHCNFQLRGDESDQDMEFVKKQVLIHGVPAFFETFETEEYARIQGISIEMAARELRYRFFEEVRSGNGFNCIATAHHQDDLMETFFLNLARKTGIKGLTGIREKTGNIIRPLLFASREEIENYASEHFIEFREDSTNREVVYQRNFLRHKILPLFNEWNPAFRKNTIATIENLKEAEKIYLEVIEREKAGAIVFENDSVTIDIEVLLKSDFSKTLLFEIVADFGFNAVVADEIFQSLGGEPGKQFFSSSHRLVKDREKLIIKPVSDDESRIFYIEKEDMELFEPLDISIEKFRAKGFKIIKSANVACLDFDKLEFPLLIRKWQQGDYFQPLGLGGFKKVSDFFIDEKLPLPEKENTWLLCSNNKIVWIMGRRIDDRFKISKQTKTVLLIEIK